MAEWSRFKLHLADILLCHESAELALGVDDVNTARIMMSRFSHYSEDNSMSLFIKLRIEEGSGDIEEAKKYGDLLLTRYPNSPEAKKYQNNDY